MDKCSTTKLPGQLSRLDSNHYITQGEGKPQSLFGCSQDSVFFVCPLFRDPCVVVNTCLMTDLFQEGSSGYSEVSGE